MTEFGIPEEDLALYRAHDSLTDRVYVNMPIEVLSDNEIFEIVRVYVSDGVLRIEVKSVL